MGRRDRERRHTQRQKKEKDRWRKKTNTDMKTNRESAEPLMNKMLKNLARKSTFQSFRIYMSKNSNVKRGLVVPSPPATEEMGP
jgi:hypothetical protein